MDVVAIRLANIRALVAEFDAAGKNQRQSALELDMSPSFLSQLVGGKKMGDDVARKIESARRLPHGWMDQLHGNRSAIGEAPADYVTSHSLRIDPETIAAATQLVRLSFLNLSLEFDNEQDGTPLAFAYEYLFRRGEHVVTADNVVDFSKRLAARLRESTDDATADQAPSRISRSVS